MPLRPLSVRLVAALLATLLCLTGPGAALAHGVAHVREHRVAEHHEADDHHAARLRDRLADVVDGRAHDDLDATASAIDAHAAGVAASANVPAPHDMPLAQRPRNDAHDHVRLDTQAVSRLAVDALLPARPMLVPAAPVIVSRMPPPAASPLRLAEPPTGPPPPSRAPPLG